MAGPTSARLRVEAFSFCAGAFAADLAFAVILLIVLFVVRLTDGLKQKPAAVSSRGFLLNLSSTSANGFVSYDDYQNDNL
jgi:hypothetical protein